MGTSLRILLSLEQKDEKIIENGIAFSLCESS